MQAWWAHTFESSFSLLFDWSLTANGTGSPHHHSTFKCDTIELSIMHALGTADDKRRNEGGAGGGQYRQDRAGQDRNRPPHGGPPRGGYNRR